jgi:hypothetical protein
MTTRSWTTCESIGLEGRATAPHVSRHCPGLAGSSVSQIRQAQLDSIDCHGARGASGLSGLSQHGRPSLACGAPECPCGVSGLGWLGASPGGCAWRASPKRKRVVGAPMVLKTSGHRSQPGRPHCVGCERCTAPSAGARGGHPTTAAPKVHRGPSIVKECRPDACSGTVARHSQLVGPHVRARGRHIFMGAWGPSER